MSYSDRSDGGNTNPFEGTPTGGSPHWFNRPGHTSVGDVAREVAIGAADTAVISAALAYLATGDGQKAFKAAQYSVVGYLAMLPFGFVGGIAVIFGLLATVGGDFGFAAVLLSVAGLCTWACVGICRRVYRRINPLYQPALPSVPPIPPERTG